MKRGVGRIAGRHAFQLGRLVVTGRCSSSQARWASGAVQSILTCSTLRLVMQLVRAAGKHCARETWQVRRALQRAAA